VVKRETTISWVWDVFDRDDRRALRIAGDETANGRHHDASSADAMLQRIARSSMDQLAAFLISPKVAPGMPDSAPQTVDFGPTHASLEAAGIPMSNRCRMRTPRLPRAPARSHCRAGRIWRPWFRPGKR
jgi:hypothetical protein